MARVAEKSADVEAHVAVEGMIKGDQGSQGSLQVHEPAKAADVEAPVALAHEDQGSRSSLVVHQPATAADLDAPLATAHLTEDQGSRGSLEVHQPAEAADVGATLADVHLPKGDEGNSEENTMAYKAFWSKFKRPSSTSLVEKEPKDDDSNAAVADPMVPPQELAPKAMEVSDSPIYGAEFFVDNQLGDPTLHPPTPSPAEVEVAETLKDSPHKVPLVDVGRVDGDGGVPGTPNGGAADGSSASFPLQSPLDKQHKFAPSHEDVKACLLRKTTMDLASPSLPPPKQLPPPVAEVASAMNVHPKELCSMTSVVMNLAGVPQDC